MEIKIDYNECTRSLIKDYLMVIFAYRTPSKIIVTERGSDVTILESCVEPYDGKDQLVYYVDLNHTCEQGYNTLSRDDFRGKPLKEFKVWNPLQYTLEDYNQDDKVLHIFWKNVQMLFKDVPESELMVLSSEDNEEYRDESQYISHIISSISSRITKVSRTLFEVYDKKGNRAIHFTLTFYECFNGGHILWYFTSDKASTHNLIADKLGCELIK